MSTNPAPDFLTPEEVAQVLRVNAMTVRRLVSTGELPGNRVGRQWRIPRAELDRYLTASSTASS